VGFEHAGNVRGFDCRGLTETHSRGTMGVLGQTPHNTETREDRTMAERIANELFHHRCAIRCGMLYAAILFVPVVLIVIADATGN